jgi:hypothetical protein
MDSLSPKDAAAIYEMGCPRKWSWDRHKKLGYWHGVGPGNTVSCNASGIPRGIMRPTLTQILLDKDAYGASVDHKVREDPDVGRRLDVAAEKHQINPFNGKQE